MVLKKGEISDFRTFLRHFLHQPHRGGGGSADTDCLCMREVDMLQLVQLRDNVTLGIVRLTYII